MKFAVSIHGLLPPRGLEMAKNSARFAARIAMESFQRSTPRVGPARRTRTSITLAETALRDAKILAAMSNVPLNSIFLRGLSHVLQQAGFSPIEGMPQDFDAKLEKVAAVLRTGKLSIGSD